MARIVVLLYGVVAYVVFLASFLYAIGFVGNLAVSKTIDRGATAGTFSQALASNVALLGLFALQHSVMARPGFKRAWTKIVPEPVERSTYVLLASLVLFLLYWQWRPLVETVWDVQNPVVRAVLHALFWLGWGDVLVSTFLINHFDLFGLRQVSLYLRRQPYTPVGFKTVGLYKVVRHPIMLGFIIAFWATPTMTVGHLLFAIATTAYILIAIQLEERDLLGFHGDTYRAYRNRTSMLVPLPPRKQQ